MFPIHTRILFLSFFFINLFSPAKAEELTVAGAISLKNLLTEISQTFEKENNTKIYLHFGASGLIQNQIEHGAPIDIFASAGEKPMDQLEKKGLIDKNSRKDFASNQLVLITPSSNKKNFTSYKQLTSPLIQKIAVGNPKTVPAGDYTKTFFSQNKMWDVLFPKFIFAENVRQALEYVVRGEVDAGIVYATDINTPFKNPVHIVETLNHKKMTIKYSVALLKTTDRLEEGKNFIGFLTGNSAKKILIKHRFIPRKI